MDEIVANAPAPEAPAAAPAPAPPRFVNEAARVKTIPLEHPVEYDGVVYSEIVLKRLSTQAVAEFLDSIKDAPTDAKITFPIFHRPDGVLVPEIVMQSLDEDDMMALTEEAANFLPRRFRAPATSATTPSTGASTEPSSDAG